MLDFIVLWKCFWCEVAATATFGINHTCYTVGNTRRIIETREAAPGAATSCCTASSSFPNILWQFVKFKGSCHHHINGLAPLDND